MDAELLGYKYVHITNDYMFAYVMQDEKLCIALLETLLPGHKIERLVYYTTGEDGLHAVPMKSATQKALFAEADKRSVRLDVYLDDGKTVYNVEMQTTDTPSLPQRSRMYQSREQTGTVPFRCRIEGTAPRFLRRISRPSPRQT